MPSSRLLYRLVPSARRTGGTGFGLWRGGREGDLLKTPTAMDARAFPPKAEPQSGDSRCLAQEFVGGYAEILPTPTASDSKGGVKTVRSARAERPGLMSLSDIFESGMLPTPVAQDWRRRSPNSGQKGLPEVFHELMHTPVADGLKKRERNWQRRMNGEDFERLFPGMSRGSTDGTPSRLNPLFVQEMMGFPSVWLTSPFLSDGGGRRR